MTTDRPDTNRRLSGDIHPVSVDVHFRVIAAEGGAGAYISDVSELASISMTIPLTEDRVGIQVLVQETLAAVLGTADDTAKLFAIRHREMEAEMEILREKLRARTEKDSE